MFKECFIPTFILGIMAFGGLYFFVFNMLIINYLDPVNGYIPNHITTKEYVKRLEYESQL